MLRPACLVLFTCCAVSAVAETKLLRVIEGARRVETPWADGDSFAVCWSDPADSTVRTNTVRLYAVDCAETSADRETERRRLRNQAAHFGIGDGATMLRLGIEARDRTAELLREPFVVATAFARAPSGSAEPRYYAFVRTSDGQDLGETLVREGLASARGVVREHPSGVSAVDYRERLRDLELQAALRRRGAWKHSDPDRIAEAREEERREQRELLAFAREGQDGPVPIDANTATIDQLSSLPGIGAALAARIVAGRPYETVDDLADVPSIGTATIERLRPLLACGGSDD